MYYNKKEYKEMLKVKRDYKVIFKNALMAFLGGGVICLIGQIIYYIFSRCSNFDETDLRTCTVGIMVLISAILSALGIYDKIGQVVKCGSVIPITGFANATVSSAMEYNPEGFILGIGANAFKLSGAVIVLGVFFAYLVGLIRYLVFLL